MKIIKPGKLPEKRIWRGTCNNCGQIAEGEEREMVRIVHDPRDGTRVCSMPCSCCKREVYFYPKKDDK